MSKLLSRLLFLLLLPVCGSAAAQTASQCDPSKFLKYDVDASEMTNFVKLAYLDSVDQKSFSDTSFSHDGGMTIPYINMPIKGSWDYARKTSSSLANLLDIDLSQEQREAVFRAHVSSVGSDAYKACIANVEVALTVPESAITSKAFVAELVWTPKHGEDGKLTNIPIIMGGSLLAGYKLPDKIQAGSKILIPVTREGDSGVTIAVEINQEGDQISLPPLLSKHIVVDEAAWTSPEVRADSNNSNGYGMHTDEKCYSPPDGKLFVMGSEQPITPQLEGADSGSHVEYHVDERRACLKVFARDASGRNGAAVRSSLTILTMSLQNVAQD